MPYEENDIIPESFGYLFISLPRKSDAQDRRGPDRHPAHGNPCS